MGISHWDINYGHPGSTSHPHLILQPISEVWNNWALWRMHN
jgi:hypothetical protein